jgi:hypothetical protein
MSDYYYGVCCDHIGSAVEIRCHDGGHYIGYVDSVDRDMVYLRPLEEDDCPPDRGCDGPGLFLWGFGGAFAGGFAGGLLGVALGSILFVRPYGFW